MTEEYSKIYYATLSVLLTLLESDEITYNDSKKIYSFIIKLQFENNINDKVKTEGILKNSSEYVLQKLWFTVFKNCQEQNIINIFKNEIIDRGFQHNFWCQEVLNHSALTSYNTDPVTLYESYFNDTGEDNMSDSDGKII